MEFHLWAPSWTEDHGSVPDSNYARNINIDLKKFQTHTDTKAYLDTLLLNNFVPVVVMPTRISNTSATLIRSCLLL